MARLRFSKEPVLSGLFFLLFLLLNQSAMGQRWVKGLVLEETAKGQFQPAEGASVFWLGKAIGTTTDSLGNFQIQIPEQSPDSNALVIRYLGYKPDTLRNFTNEKIRVVLAMENSLTLKEVSVEGRIPPSFQLSDPMNISMMTGKELLKAACCNLSESFETNPTVEVNYSDAVTGAKQIQMLGLSGNYTMMTQENLPGVRGLMAGFGLGFTPGPWVESIQVTKGLGSVANGFESITGQINVELKKPDWTPKNREKLFVNLYGNSMGRLEMNANATQKISNRWHTTTLIHGNWLENKVDMNHDGFMDMPTGKQANVLHRWAYSSSNGWSAQLGGQWMREERVGGQIHANHNLQTHEDEKFGINLNHHQWQTFGKLGYVFPSKKYKSIGLMSSFNHFETNQTFGPVNQYNGNQNTWYSNLIYQSIIGSTNLKFRTGASFRYDQYQENIQLRADSVPLQLQPNRVEKVPGVFGEFTWNPTVRLTTVMGFRADYHNLFGFWATPRLHLKYELRENSAIRISAGNGRRLANIFAENTHIMSSSRNYSFPQNLYSQKQNGLLPEMAWNYGISWNHGFEWLSQKGNFTIDAYQTRFENQIIMDLDASARQINFYNLDGKSYSNAVQAMLEYELVKRLDIRMAYKWLDVWQTYHGQLLERPLVARHRFFVNLAYQTRNKWSFDATFNWNGTKRIASTQSNPEGFVFPERSPSFFVVNGQVSKTFRKKLDVYLGVENLFDFRQTRLINQVDNPVGPYFDASLVWGPVIGRMVYTGLRWKL